MEFRVDGKTVQAFEVKAEEDRPAVFEARSSSRTGQARIRRRLHQRLLLPRRPGPDERDRNLVVEYVEVRGPPIYRWQRLPEFAPADHLPPADAPEPPRGRPARSSTGSPPGPSAGPPPTGEVDRLVKLVDLAKKNGEQFERGIQLAVQAVLVSPHFLFRVELDRDPAKDGPPDPDTISSWPPGSRTSSGAHARRRAARPRRRRASSRTATTSKRRSAGCSRTEVAGARRELRRPVAPDPEPQDGQPRPKPFPDFDESLRAAMHKETEMFFEAIDGEDRSILDFLDADLHVPQRAAGPALRDRRASGGDEFRRVTLTDGRARRGR